MSQSLPHPLALSGDLSLRSIAELHAKLTQAFAAHDAVAIGTDAVESIDVASVQLLVSATKTAAAQGRTLTVTAAANGPVARTLIAAGFFAADGSPKLPTLSTWTISREAA
jgi:ABC-type transporter Mla MlaB component